MARLARGLSERALPGGPTARGTGLDGVDADAFASLLPPHRGRQAGLSELGERLRSCVHPDLYAAQLPETEREALGELDVEAVLAHFLAGGARGGLRVSALFQPAWYARQLADRAMELPEGVLPFFHWLTVGWEARIVPTPLFDEGFYREQHPALDQPWLFPHYLARGCYHPHWRPSPLGRHHLGGAEPDAVSSRRPLLLRQLLHRADEFDLRVTSWLEEGCCAALAKRDRLESPQLRALVAKAAEVEPLIHTPPARRRMLSSPPQRNQRLFLVELVETVRRAVGVSRVDTVVVGPEGSSPLGTLARTFAESWHATDAAGSTLLVSAGSAAGGPGVPRSAAAGPGSSPEAGLRCLDLGDLLTGVDREGRLAILLDLVRGLGARRVVVVGSDLGWDLLAGYGRQLSAGAELGAFLSAAELGAQEETIGPGVGRFQSCFRHLSWAALEGEPARDDLVRRYLLPRSDRQRLLVAADGHELADRVLAARGSAS